MANEKNNSGTLQLALRLVGVGFYIGGCIAGGVLLGLWIDSKYNTRPLFAIAGLIVGIALAFYGVYEMLIPLFERKHDKRD